MTKTITVALTISTENEAEAIEVAEQLSRQAIGFALRGLRTETSIDTWEESDIEAG